MNRYSSFWASFANSSKSTKTLDRTTITKTSGDRSATYFFWKHELSYCLNFSLQNKNMVLPTCVSCSTIEHRNPFLLAVNSFQSYVIAWSPQNSIIGIFSGNKECNKTSEYRDSWTDLSLSRFLFFPHKKWPWTYIPFTLIFHTESYTKFQVFKLMTFTEVIVKREKLHCLLSIFHEWCFWYKSFLENYLK